MLHNIVCIYDNVTWLDRLSSEWSKYGGCLTYTRTSHEAIKATEEKEHQLIILSSDYVKEQLLPSIKMIRDVTVMPILIVADTHNSSDMYASIRSGADGYALTSAPMEELVVLGFSHIRRYSFFEGERHDKDALVFHEIHLDLRQRIVTVDGNASHLTRGEFECLRMLMSQQDRIFTHEQLYYGSYGEQAQAELIIASVRSLIRRIRQKIGPKNAKCIQSVNSLEYNLH